jgi:hypothetical protein
MARCDWRGITAAAALGILVASPQVLATGARHHTGSSKAGMQSESLTARLVDPEKKAREKAATVEVHVNGVKLVDPALSKEQPRKGQAHLHYKLDDGPIIATTTTTKLSFHELKPGEHTIVVALAANDHKPLGPEQTVNVSIP